MTEVEVIFNKQAPFSSKDENIKNTTLYSCSNLLMIKLQIALFK
ncbi:MULTISPECIES: hypothetical protein [Acinetobacter]|uniref:Uncharacterized protein n=1 Tax=Acinetobacter pittii TaxID=48296 RepID=K9CDZ5_ACIPI|nr:MULTISPECIES: hypothetical protein [Acinetobacter]QNB02303.1 hypothetical protein H2Q98_13500 [Acinetobacter baumannii]AUT34331.1 hypothetical protein C2U64_11065 [Acinetobacter pittii]AVN22014.1 hypothetical protein C6N17_09845 [Acinetobacter pittii]AZB92698.1 hypothetical protein DKC15_009200 [Acinetobacter pittii]AZB94787.1 hypothetical protein DKE46_009610 [Acinetobacter pittii]